MCGIVGYTGMHEASPILVAGLRRLEYRGYDSAGLAAVKDGRLEVRKRAGRVRVLEEMLERQPLAGRSGISHTRWATHGAATDSNAHPHLGGRGDRHTVAVVHNGVIENHSVLRKELAAEGFVFQSQTDTEVIAHLIARELERTSEPFEAVQNALPRLEGTYGLGVICLARPGEVIGARFGSPLVVGVGDDEHLLASDAVAIAPHTVRVAYLQDGEVVRLTATDFEIRHLEHGPITPRIDRIDWKPDAVELGGHAHYMLKEIREQPDTVLDACRGRLRRPEATAQFGGLNMTARQLRRIHRIVFAACGTSWHAAMVGEYLIERLAHLPVEVEYASEFRYRDAPLDDRTLVFVLSQSGETADTLARCANRDGAVIRRWPSSIPSAAPSPARPTAVSTCTPAPRWESPAPRRFPPRSSCWPCSRLHLGRLRHLSFPDGLAVLEAIELVPNLIGEVLKTESAIDGAAELVAPARSALFLGRDIHFPVALEGALKLKEISYIHAEGYPTAEMKHGPIALVDRQTPCVFVAPRGSLHAKTMSNVEEVKARHGLIISVGTEGDSALAELSDVFLPIPEAPEVIQPLLAVVPLQLLAYHVARRRGCDIDKPRNLAKSVTVE